jgi:MoaA/NifB/PqqE/SkfB family radical SAM enzyme
MQYDVECDWQLLNTCNYRCTAGNEAWAKSFDDTGLTWLLHMTGGEPSAYPGFADLCERLSRKHLLSINSNMTNRSWEEFALRVNPKRISFINAGLHLAEREKRNGNESYLRNVKLLKDFGFQIMASIVATPDILEKFSDAVDLLAPIGMYPIPKLLRGLYENKGWPNSYNKEHRRIFRLRNEEAKRFYAGAFSGRDEKPTIDIFSDGDFLHGTPDYSGRNCEAGRLFFKIEMNGDVFRCGDSRRYGNILNGSFFRESRSSPCDSYQCFYFCEKYSDPPSLSKRVHRLARNTAREFLR